ncbi:MAG: NAD(P)-binding domain-containing protein [Myxococcales bacterium]|nr:NAD(P)-binding domain-containing protein [Myxococcales bacterium]
MKVLVVGAGPSGLVTLKELLDEGIDARCIDIAPRFGGVFDHGAPQGRVYDSTLLTVSNAFMAFGTFPHDLRDARRFWTHHEYFDYLERFVRHYALGAHIRFGVRLDSVRLTDTGASVTLSADERVWSEDYDSVALCVGTNQIPKQPVIDGIETFSGEVVHSCTYRNAEPYRGKKVVSIGIGETGADVVHEISRVAERTVLSLRHYPSIVERFPYGQVHPNDAYSSRALYSAGRHTMQCNILETRRARMAASRSATETLLCEWVIRGGGLMGQWYTKNDIFLQDIVDGRLETDLSGIRRIEGDTVVFRSGLRVEADVIMCNTGYRDATPAVGLDFADVRDLYKHMIHPDAGLRIALIGWARPEVGGAPTCSEMQARYYALLLSGRRRLPDSHTLERLIAEDRQYEESWFVNTPRPPSIVPYVWFCDGLARLIGCHPLEDGSIRDPRLLAHLWFGSLVSAQYRLVGPHACPEQARRTIEALPLAFLPYELPRLGMRLFLNRRLPRVAQWLDARAGRRAREIVEAFVSENGGFAHLPDGGTVGEPPGAWHASVPPA